MQHFSKKNMTFQLNKSFLRVPQFKAFTGVKPTSRETRQIAHLGAMGRSRSRSRWVFSTNPPPSGKTLGVHFPLQNSRTEGTLQKHGFGGMEFPGNYGDFWMLYLKLSVGYNPTINQSRAQLPMGASHKFWANCSQPRSPRILA